MSAHDQDLPVITDDWTKQLTNPHRLYGREEAASILNNTFNRICYGEGEVVLIPGNSGTGKTSLVKELQNPVMNRNGIFLHGKFNQYQQNIPYFAFRQALTELACELGSEEDVIRQQWQRSLNKALGSLGQLLLNFIPEFKKVLGPQPPVAEISPLEAKYRFISVIQKLMETLCRAEHPVVLFIDDWQWADPASLELLKQLQISSTLRYLLVIIPYRDNEIDSNHPLVTIIDELRHQHVPISIIEIKNLSLKDVQTWITDVLQPSVENPKGLAKFIYQQTRGNPFFTQASLLFLNNYSLLNFDQGNKCWRWINKTNDVDKLPDSIANLFLHQLLRLGPESQILLSKAACLGNRFNLDNLAVTCKLNTKQCLALLLDHSSMVIPTSADGFSSASSRQEADQWFRFIHDQVQQAAYNLIHVNERPVTHLEIGRLILASLDPVQLSHRLFEVVNHINLGKLLIIDLTEQVQVVELNVAAARKAWTATAYKEALQYHRSAGYFLTIPDFGEYLWSNHRKLALSLFKEWAENEFLEGDEQEGNLLINQVFVHAENALEKAEALTVLILQNTLKARYREAINAGRLALAAFKIFLPEDNYEAACDEEIKQVRSILEQRTIASLSDLPVMSDPEMHMIVKILITMGPPCYRSHQKLWGVIVSKVVSLTLRFGNVEQIGYSHPAFAGLLCWVANDQANALEFGELASKLMSEVFHSPSARSVYALMIGSSVRHWHHHLTKGSSDYAEACEIGLQSGNLQYTAYALGHDMYCKFYSGCPLDALIRISQKSLAFSRTRFNQWAIDLLEGGLRIFSLLSIPDQETLAYEFPQEDDYLKLLKLHQNIQVVCIYKIMKAFSLMLLGRYDEALEISTQVQPILYTVGMQGLLPWPESVMTRLLILTALPKNQDLNLQTQRDIELTGSLAQLRHWADSCPENFEPLYQLAAAELARLELRYEDAMIFYEQAVAGAKDGGFIQWEAITNERIARFWSEQGNIWLTQNYWQQAYNCYNQWGAKSKLWAMEVEYRQWLEAAMPSVSASGDSKTKQIRTDLLEKQIQFLNEGGLKDTNADRQPMAERQAVEFEIATEHLRAEVTERKRVAIKLQLAKNSIEEGLLNERLLMAAIVESSEDAIICRTLDGIITNWNRGAENIFGYSAEEILGQSILVLIPSDLLNKEKDLLASILQGNSIKHYETIRLCKAGNKINVSITASPIRDKNGQIIAISNIAHDITSRKVNESNLRLAANVFTHAREGIMITSPDGKIVDVNKTFLHITGYNRDEILGQTPHILSSGRYDKQYYSNMWRDLTEKGHWYGEIWNRRKNGEEYAALQNISVVRDAQGNIQQFVSLFSDITMLKTHEKELEHIAHYDALTGLPNRILLADRLTMGLTQTQRRQKHLAVVYLDLDGFKVINDSYGHHIGDQLLIDIASRMKQALRESDTLARLGGDEFVAILVDLDTIDACVPMLTRLLALASLPVCVDNLSLTVTASLGVTFYPQAEDISADQLLRQADQAMYQAKLSGKNRYHTFDAQMDRNARGLHESLERIQEALSKQEFVLYYQPKVNMRQDSIIGLEALIRWQHPEKGLLPPLVFLPLIENHSLSVEVGNWVLKTVLIQMEHWRTVGINIPISVNISARQIQQSDFVERLRTLLAAHPDIMPWNLELEVLETSALEDLSQATRVIDACKEIGVNFSMDDFGTGYSSLTYLKRLPISTIKIDQSFVRDILTDPDDLAILIGVMGLANAFGHQVVAEGVESVEHGILLLKLGCELAQGYSIAYPMPPQELPGWSAAWHIDPSWVDVPSLDPNDLQLLFAIINQRACTLSVETYLKDNNKSSLILDPHLCRFGKWLSGEGQARYGGQPAFQTITVLHARVHALAKKQNEYKTKVPVRQLNTQLAKLNTLQNTIYKQISILEQGVP